MSIWDLLKGTDAEELFTTLEESLGINKEVKQSVDIIKSVVDQAENLYEKKFLNLLDMPPEQKILQMLMTDPRPVAKSEGELDESYMEDEPDRSYTEDEAFQVFDGSNNQNDEIDFDNYISALEEHLKEQNILLSGEDTADTNEAVAKWRND